MSIFYEQRIENFITLAIYNNNCSAHLHRHVELMYMTKGSMDITVNSVPYRVNEGQCSLIFPNMVHSGAGTSNSLAFYFIWSSSFISEYKALFEKYIPKSPIIDLKNGTREKDALDNLISLMDNPNAKMLSKGYLTVFLAEILDNAHLSPHNNVSNYDICQKLLMYLDNHYTEAITLDEIAKNLNINKFYVSHLLSDKLGISLTGYLTLRRIEMAKSLLLTTANPITEIAYDSGFSSMRSFYRCFKSSCGCSPAVYRRTVTSI